MNINLTWGDIVVHFLIACTAGLIVSIIFLRFVLYFLRPKIIISPEIAIEGEPGGEQLTYWFKMVNHSWWSGFELVFNAEIIVLEPAQNGCYHMKHSGDIRIERTTFSAIAPYQTGRRIRKTKSSAPHCVQVRSLVNIPQIVADKNHFIILHVSLKHGLSGLFKSFDQTFTHQSVIRKGYFGFGNQLNVI